MTGQLTSRPICPSCGAEVPPDAPRGYCLHCLFALGTASPEECAQELDPHSAAIGAPLRSFGDYDLLEEIARGGMGIVYRARQKSLGRVVALKMLLFGEQSGSDLAQRFRAEAAVAASLQHPNIVAIHEVGAHDGQAFFVMDYVEGKSLARLAAGQPMPATRAARYVRIVAEAIHYAHERGILHRDLKPSNVLIDPFDEPRVTDFGLAKQLHRDSELTLSGQVLGSPNYMPPEQAAARRGLVGRRSDVYSLGAILYHLLTGRPPFVGETLTDTLLKVVNQEPVPPRLLSPGVPIDLETLCLKCLEKEPGRRYPTAEALAGDLQRFLSHQPIQARPVGLPGRFARWCRRKPAVAVLVVALHVVLAAGLAGILWQWRRAEEGERAARRGQLSARQTAYASDMGLVQQALAESNLGRAHELLERHRPGRRSDARNPDPETQDLRGWEWRYLWRQCQGEQRFILGEHTNGVSAVGLLVDGKTVFSAGGDKCVRLWDLESRHEIGLLLHPEEVIGAAASPDGRWLATATRKEAEGQPLLLWDLAARKVEATFTTNFWLRAGSIRFSPDGKWVAFGTMFGGIRLWDMKERREVPDLPFMDPSTGGFAFSPDSRTLAYGEDEYGAILLWDMAGRSFTGRLIGHEADVTALAFSPDGRTLASGSQDRTARLWSLADRRELLQFTNNNGGFTGLAFSTDSRALALSGEGGAGCAIRIVDVEKGEEKARLAGHLEEVSGMIFTRDRQTLLSASGDDTVRAWDLVPHEKEKSSHRFARHSISSNWRSYGPALCLSPDGRYLLTVYTNQTFGLWDTLGLMETDHPPLPFTNTTIAAVAPGGRLAAFGSRQGEVVQWDVARSEKLSFARFGTNQIRRLVFSPDGRYLAAADDYKLASEMSGSNDDPRRRVRVWNVETREEVGTFTPNGAFLWSFAFSADSESLIAGTWRGSVMVWRLNGPAEPSTFLGHSDVVRGVALLSDGRTFVVASGDILFLDARNRRQTGKLSPRSGGFSALAVSPDGHRMAAGASDGRITIWDVASREETATFEGHEESVSQLAFTADGDQLVSVSADQLRVWRATSAADIGALEQAGPTTPR